MDTTYTITFGDQAENHVGMQKIGSLAEEGLNLEDLEKTIDYFGVENIELIDLKSYFYKNSPEENINEPEENINEPEENINEPEENINEPEEAYLLIIKDGLNILFQNNQAANLFYEEQRSLEYDSKAYMYGRVVNKKARHNICFSDFNQEPDYENKKGRVISFEYVPFIKALRDFFPLLLGDKTLNLEAEGNLYYDPKTCGIGFHGDSERKIVVAIRLGDSLPLNYHWFYRGNPIGERFEKIIDHGDIYIMSEKATGHDWKRKIIPTLRHAAGSEKYLKIKSKQKIVKIETPSNVQEINKLYISKNRGKQYYDKNQLIEICELLNIHCYKSWTKSVLVDVINQSNID